MYTTGETMCITINTPVVALMLLEAMSGLKIVDGYQDIGFGGYQVITRDVVITDIGCQVDL